MRCLFAFYNNSQEKGFLMPLFPFLPLTFVIKRLSDCYISTSMALAWEVVCFSSVTRRDSEKQFWAWYPMAGRQSRVEVSWICCCLESGSIFPGWLSWLSCVTWDGSCWPKSLGGLTATTAASTREPSAVSGSLGLHPCRMLLNKLSQC